MVSSLETVTTAVAGAGGGVVGMVVAWLGIKARMDSMEKTLEKLVHSTTCDANRRAMTQRIDNSISRFNRVDANIEVITKMLIDRHYPKRDP